MYNYTEDSPMQHELHEYLNGMLWHYAISHRKKTDSNARYIIVFGDEPKVDVCIFNHPLCPYFNDEETAKEALETIVKPFLKRHPQFIW